MKILKPSLTVLLKSRFYFCILRCKVLWADVWRHRSPWVLFYYRFNRFLKNNSLFPHLYVMGLWRDVGSKEGETVCCLELTTYCQQARGIMVCLSQHFIWTFHPPEQLSRGRNSPVMVDRGVSVYTIITFCSQLFKLGTISRPNTL